MDKGDDFPLDLYVTFSDSTKSGTIAFKGYGFTMFSFTVPKEILGMRGINPSNVDIIELEPSNGNLPEKLHVRYISSDETSCLFEAYVK
mgnify:CR=1 FL=1